MDQLSAMRTFIATLDAGSLSAAARLLGRSPAAVSRAIDDLEAHVGVQLLHRTTRTIRLSDAGERYATACRRLLSDLEEADLAAAGEGAAPRGLLTLTGPLVSGARVLRPILDAFLDAFPAVKAKLLLLDRQVNLVDEGVDVGLRIAHLPDSSLIALRVGEVRRLICAAPAYLAARPPIRGLDDLAEQDCICMTAFGQEVWSFATPDGQQRQIRMQPRLIVNTVEAAVTSAAEGRGLTRVFSYQVADEITAGRLVPVLPEADASAWPVHLIVPEGRLAVPKVRAFVDFALPRLKAEFGRISGR
ncbi:LysR family transcriptional regulator [Ferrovibrio terrae]|uniref:LysR family transcriptional regulator n=1 Tax=Ferrovibrio terrae TaxID=2594003 RepID=A0A516H3Y8_9PROT|nr:LysR family transcriptional regulator [Ferrovibrio terrae]QDO98493.1 LysR family transcriptional regulator [Ferrovibrio terrae]